MTDTEFATVIWDRYEDALACQTSSGIRKSIPEYVSFYEGKQWPPPTKNTRNLPRPVINIVKMICRLKKSAILSTPVRIIYKCGDKRIDTDTFNDFSSHILKEIDQDSIDREAIDEATKKGCYFYHYFWDSDKYTENEFRGGLGCELIDPLNIFFENPCELDEQKQKWIIISTRENVENVRKNADTGVNIHNILPDNDSRGDAKADKSRLCTVLTMYYREDGIVYCVKSVKGAIVKRPFSIAPNIDLAYEALELENVKERHSCGAKLYPIVCGYYEKKDKCIYGLSEVEGLIPNQKAINFNIAMSLLNAQEVAWGKYIALPGALKGQTINNAPGQVLIDYSGTGNGIKKLQENYMQSFPMELVKTITDLTRSVTGTSEFMTGEIQGSGMSGTAIARLQSQAQLPIEDLRALFMSVKRKQGRVLAQFYKLYYPSCAFTVEKDGKSVHKCFLCKNYADTEFEVLCETVSGVNASAAGDISMLDTVLKHGKISLDAYINAYPDDALTDKKKLLERIKESENGACGSMEAELSELKAQLKEAKETVEKQNETVNQVLSIIRENRSLKEFISKEYSNGKQYKD